MVFSQARARPPVTEDVDTPGVAVLTEEEGVDVSVLRLREPHGGKVTFTGIHGKTALSEF